MKTNRFNFDMWDKKDKKYIKNVHKFFDLNECIENDNFILLQHTNKKDKNGNTLVEGNIVRETFYDENREISELLVVTWDEDKQAFGLATNGKPINDLYFTNYDCKSDNIEIVGNIHENPDLLDYARHEMLMNLAEMGVNWLNK